jgi:MFS family permease
MSQGNSAARVLAASLIGTTIEFFDFYIYATAAVLVFPKLFFPSSDANTAILQSLATFALAFFARPVGAALFGHFGDRIGRKATLVAALMTMGPSTVAIGFLPTYQSIGIVAPILLALFRFGQGLGLGGEWGGAVLLATENAPEGKRAWYGMFPQMGAPIGFLLSSGTFLILSKVLTDQEFFEYGWRIPFIASAVLVFVGLYVRLKIEETPAFLEAIENNQRVQMPMMEVFKAHTSTLLFATLLSITTFALFYLMTVFTLSWGTSVLHYPRSSFLIAQMIAVVFFAIGIPVSALLADRFGCTRVLMGSMLAVITFGLFFAPLFTVADWTMTVMFLALGLLLMGFTYGPLGTALGLLFPTEVRYTGSSLAFTLAGILGASLAPYIATWLATNYGLEYVGYYLALAATISFLALVAVRHKLK